MRTIKRVLISLVALTAVAPLLVPATGVLAARHTAMHTLVRTAHNAKLGEILVNAHGMTLYIFDNDKHDKSACAGKCAVYWPPLTLPKGMSVAAACHGVSGKFAAIKRAGGAHQISYDGHPLYTFAGDKKAGQTHGQGIGKVWWVATVKASSSSSSGGSGW